MVCHPNYHLGNSAVVALYDIWPLNWSSHLHFAPAWSYEQSFMVPDRYPVLLLLCYAGQWHGHMQMKWGNLWLSLVQLFLKISSCCHQVTLWFVTLINYHLANFVLFLPGRILTAWLVIPFALCSRHVSTSIGLENGVLVLASHSLSDHIRGFNHGRSSRHLLIQMFQQQIKQWNGNKQSYNLCHNTGVKTIYGIHQ